MLEFFRRLFDTADFPQRWHCGTWSDELGWLHIGSDLAVFASYMAIPLVLIYFLRRRPDWPFNRFFMLFAIFIFACGTVHLIEAMIFWWPVYRLSGLVKLVTAAASLATAVALVPAAPKALAMRSPGELQAEIEQRKLAETQLRASEDRLLLSVEATDLAIWDQNLEDNQVWLNENYQRVFGRPTNEGASMEWWEYKIHPEDRQRIASSLNNFIQHGSKTDRWTDEYRFRKSDHKYAYVKDIVLRHRDQNNKAQRILRAMHDVTLLKQQEEERLKSERLLAIGQAMTGLVHESRNAIARSLAGLHLLSRKLEDQPELLRYIHEVETAQKDVGHLFEEVRQYAAPMQLNRTQLYLPDVVQAAWEQVLKAADPNISPTLNQETAPNLDLHLHLDAFAMTSVLRNLYENSLAACDATPNINVSYEETMLNDKAAITIHYSDNGSGLDHVAREQVFDAFFTTKSQGTGLGMAIAKRTIEEHAGSIEVSDANGRGAVFTITIPRSKPSHEC